MAAMIEFKCPNCSKPLKFPVELAGKLVRCKDCQGMFEVPEPQSAKPAPAKPAAAKPIAAKPAPAKAVPAKAAPAAPAATTKVEDAPIPLKPLEPPPPPPPPPRFDDDDGPVHYGVTDDGLDIPRCPSCALELDPPDSKVCLNCGYDLMERKRHETTKTIAASPVEVFMHLLPGIACVVGIIVALLIAIFTWLNMEDWMTGGLLDSDQKDPITGKTVFLVKPYCFNLWIGLACLIVIYLCGKFAIKRLVYEYKPEEKLMK